MRPLGKMALSLHYQILGISLVLYMAMILQNDFLAGVGIHVLGQCCRVCMDGI